MIRTIWKDQRGQEMLEFALLAAFMATAAVAVSPAVFATTVSLHRVIQVLDSAPGSEVTPLLTVELPHVSGQR